MKTVFITGASGLIGRELTKTLLSRGYNVIGTDSSPSEFVGQPNYSFVQCSVTDKAKISSILEGSKIDALIHLACSVDNDYSNIMDPNYAKDADACDKYIYKTAATAGISDILLLSTHLVYAPQKTREPIRETNADKPVTDYAKMKSESEKYLSAVIKKHPNTKGVIMRVCPIYTKTYIENLNARIYDPKDGCAFIYGTGDYGFSFCCLYNLIDFIWGVLEVPAGTNYQGVYNICDSKPIYAKEIVEYIRTNFKLGPVIQRNYGADAVKSAIAFGNKRLKTDYRCVDISTICNNVTFDNTKAQRISRFRWKLSNTL